MNHFRALRLVARRIGPVVLALAVGAAWAQQPGADRTAERNLRRMQLQVEQLQQQLQQAQAERGKLQTERDDLARQVQGREADSARRVAAASRAATTTQRALEAERDALQARLQQLETTLDGERTAATQAQAQRERERAEAAAQLARRDAALTELQGRFGEQVRMVTQCTERNERLVKLGSDLLNAYRGKGVGDALRQREPLLGLHDIELFTRAQETRDRIDAERFQPSVEPR